MFEKASFGEELLRLMHFLAFFPSVAEQAACATNESSIVAPPHKLWIGQRLVT